MEILGKLFGSVTRVKMMRLFLFNPDHFFDRREIAKRVNASEKIVGKELSGLHLADLIKKRIGVREKSGRGGREEKVRMIIWSLNPKFTYLNPVKTLLIGTILLNRHSLIERLSRAGHLRLLIAAGIFTNDLDSRVDLLIVGDRLKKGVIESAVKKIESEIGKDIRYSVFETPDFQYRFSISDKLIRDVLEYPHEKLVDRIGLRPE